jgi:hypothetical protein
VLAVGVWTDKASAQSAEVAPIEAEIAAHYATAHPEVQEYIRWTAKNFSRGSLWLPHGTYDQLTQEERDEKVRYASKVFSGDYGRHLCDTLASAGALKDQRLLPGLMKVAAYHRDDRDYDCRAKWMAVAALGRQDDESAVPVLVPLVDHGNQNTRMWARASLSRLTGQSFGNDKQAWARWWNDEGKEPQIDVASLKPWTAPGQDNAPTSSKVTTPPRIASTSPIIGAQDVGPATTEIRVTFDQDMNTDGFSWTGGGEVLPKITGRSTWVDNRTCMLPVTLEEGKFYRIGINSSNNLNFKGTNDKPAELRAVYFATKNASEDVLAMLEIPKVVSIAPADGAKDVPQTVTKLTVTFDRPMGGGFSWTKADGLFPPTAGQPSWEEGQKTCHLPVALAPGTTYTFGLNHPYANNFQSAAGVPIEPMVVAFSTAGE